MAAQDKDSRQDLSDALQFTSEDLRVNRQGQLSSRQAARIQRQAAYSVAWTAGVCVPVFIILVLLFNSPRVDGILWALALSGIPFVYNALRHWPAVRDVTALRIAKVDGSVTAVRRQPRWMRKVGPVLRLAPGHYFVVRPDAGKAVRFRVSRAAYQALHEGRYAVYYLPRARRVVSIEPLAA